MYEFNRMGSKLNKRVKGITLIELLIVVALLALLTIIAVVSFRPQLFKGKDARRKADLKRLQIAFEEYEKDNDCYPAGIPACGNSFDPYLNKIPCDPGGDSGYVYNADTTSSCPKWYWVFSELENTSDPQIEELGCTSGCGPSPSYASFNYFVMSPNAPNPYFVSNPVNNSPNYVSDYWGCLSGACTKINWDQVRNGPECDPNYTTQEACQQHCPANPCISIN